MLLQVLFSTIIFLLPSLILSLSHPRNTVLTCHPLLFYGLHHTQYVITTGTYSWNDKTFSFQLTSVITGYGNIWLKLNPHFWKHVTTIICVAQHHDSAIKCNASKTLSSVLHDKATCNLWQKKLFLWVACSIKVWMTDYSHSKEMKDVGARVGVKKHTVHIL